MGPQAPLKLHFTLVYPSIKSRKAAEIEDATRRSHAARQSHRNNRFIFPGVKTVVQGHFNKPETPERTQTELPVSKKSPPARSKQVVFRAETNHAAMSHASLGQGRIDPFDSSATKGLPSYAHHLLDLAMRHTWPTILPRLYETAPDLTRRSFVQVIISTPLVLHTILSVLPYHLACLQGRSMSPRMQHIGIKHQNSALKLLKEDIGKFNGAVPSEPILFSIMCLGSHGAGDANLNPWPYAISPLATAQDIHIYGLGQKVPAHIGAMYALVLRKGGIREIKWSLLADMLELGDLLISTQAASRPAFTWRHALQPLVPDPSWTKDQQARSFSNVIGSAFRTDTKGCQVFHVLLDAAEATIALDHSHRRGSGFPNHTALVQARNAVQHRLLSLEPSLEWRAEYQQGGVQEACRLAGLIYTDLVLFPIPTLTGVRAGFARRLRSLLDTIGYDVWEHSRFHFSWVVVMGALAVAFTPDRSWWVKLFRERCLHYFPPWQDLSTCLATHLWWDHVCDEAGKDLWYEVLGIPC